MKMSVDGTQYPTSAARIDLEVNSHVDTKIICRSARGGARGIKTLASERGRKKSLDGGGGGKAICNRGIQSIIWLLPLLSLSLLY
jgi:hypothetical protein